MKHFLPPWSDDPAKYADDVLERHSAMCRVCDLPDATHPMDLRDHIRALDDDTQTKVRLAGAQAVQRLAEMIAWAPEHEQPAENQHSALRNPKYEHVCLFGGRGGGKSHEVAEAIVEITSLETHRVVCAREFMISIDDSSKALLEDKIKASRFANQWTITDRKLKNVVTGSEITFIGVARNPQSVKSMEGATIFWGEEAAAFSQTSLDLIKPTIRKGGSRFFWSYNPESADTPIDKMFRSGEPPERSYVRYVSARDNVYFYRTRMPSERRVAFVKMQPSKYNHIWGGGYDINPDGLIYQNVTVGRVALPPDAVPLYGLDWGYSDPLGIVELFIIEPNDPQVERGTLYIRKEVYGRKIPAKDIPTRLDQDMPLARHHMITADSSEPKSIEDLQNAGFFVKGATKGPGSIRAGISFIQGYDIVISPDCPNLISESQSYMWKTTKDGTPLRDPKDQDNHGWDAVRYALEDYTPLIGDGVDYV